MPLHDVVGINCKKGTTTENQGSAVKYMGYLDVCVCVLSDLTCLPLLGVGRKSWYIITALLVTILLQFHTLLAYATYHANRSYHMPFPNP